MSIRKALEELLLIVEIHQKHTKNNFAWAEVEYAKELLAQPNPDQEVLTNTRGFLIDLKRLLKSEQSSGDAIDWIDSYLDKTCDFIYGEEDEIQELLAQPKSKQVINPDPIKLEWYGI